VIDYSDEVALEASKQSKQFDSVIDVASSVSKRLVETQSLNTIRRGMLLYLITFYKFIFSFVFFFFL
jgi:hypothetical protein